MAALLSMSRERPAKPKPIHDRAVKSLSYFRRPLEGYITPRLQRETTDAIGFVHRFNIDPIELESCKVRR